jgi:hypothetical protein
MSRWRDVLRIATLIWAAITQIHFTIWALACIVSGGLLSPWWLWIALPSGAVLGAAWWAGYRAS